MCGELSLAFRRLSIEARAVTTREEVGGRFGHVPRIVEMEEVMTRELAREVTREVTREVAREVTREVAREVAREVTREVMESVE